MTVKLGVVMDPISEINYVKDSTLALLWAAQAHDWQLYYMEPGDLYLEQGVAMGNMRHLTVYHDPSDWYSLEEAHTGELASLDVILMRKDPPFDNEFIYATYLLEVAERQGTLVVNRCQSLRDCNEKFFATQFPQCSPPTLVAKDRARLKQFHKQQRNVIFKPLDGMGGSRIFLAREDDPNVNVILDTLTHFGRSTIMAQRYIPEISSGDKRILMVDGEPIPWCLARIPAAGDTRGNLAQGATAVVQELSERDRWIAEQVGPELVKRGLVFVGLDVIGDYLTEINVTSPTCIREIEKEQKADIGNKVMASILNHLENKSVHGY